MKKISALLSALLMFLTLTACSIGNSRDAVAEEIAKYIEENSDALIEKYESYLSSDATFSALFTSFDRTAETQAKKRGFIIKYKTDISSEVTNQVLQLLKTFGYNENQTESMPEEIKKELPDIEYFTVKWYDSNGKVIFSLRYE